MIMKRVIAIVLVSVVVLVLAGIIFLSSLGVGDGNRYRPDAKIVDQLKNTQLQTEDGKRVFGPAVMEKKNGLNVLHLEGSPYEVGYQHGVLLKDEINNGSVRFYADVISSGRKEPFSLKIWLLRKYLDFMVYDPLLKHQPENILFELKGISDGSGVPFDIIFKANHHTGPSMVLTPAFAKKNVEAFEKLGIKLGACSSFAAAGKAAAGGKTIVGRNTDYGGTALWPKYPTLLFVKPSDGFAHVKIGTAGLILWNPAMNTEGIVVCPHYMVYDDVSANGWSIPAFSDEIIRKAGTLKDAEKIFTDNPRAVSAGYIVASGKEKDAFAVELSTGKASIRRMEKDRIVMTNMAVTDEKRKIDISIKYNIIEHCPARYRRLMQLIDKNYGNVDPNLAAAFMGDHIQYTTGLERAAGHIIGVADNETSAVFSPETLEFWVADGPAPVCNNPFLGFSLKDELAGKKGMVTLAVLPGYRFRNPAVRAGLDEFMLALALKETDPDNKGQIIDHLNNAWKKDPGEIIYGQLLALYSLHDGKPEDAFADIEKVLNKKQSFRELGHSRLIAGMACDLMGEREKALGYYRSILDMKKDQPADPWFGMNWFLAAFAEKYIKKPFTKDNLSDQSAEISFVDPYME
jgi:isopenicillin-N N-acyltransferase-like protein